MRQRAYDVLRDERLGLGAEVVEVAEPGEHHELGEQAVARTGQDRTLHRAGAENMRRSVNSRIAPPRRDVDRGCRAGWIYVAEHAEHECARARVHDAGPAETYLDWTPALLDRTATVRRRHAQARRATRRRGTPGTRPARAAVRLASGDRSCQRTLCGATRRSVGLRSRRARGAWQRDATRAAARWCRSRSRSTTAAITRPLFGRPPCFSADEPGRSLRHHREHARHGAVAVVGVRWKRNCRPRRSARDDGFLAHARRRAGSAGRSLASGAVRWPPPPAAPGRVAARRPATRMTSNRFGAAGEAWIGQQLVQRRQRAKHDARQVLRVVTQVEGRELAHRRVDAAQREHRREGA